MFITVLYIYIYAITTTKQINTSYRVTSFRSFVARVFKNYYLGTFLIYHTLLLNKVLVL